MVLRHALQQVRRLLPRGGRIFDHATLVFLHIPKTGGQSLRQTLLRGVGPRRAEWLRGPDDVQRLAALPVEHRRSLAYVDGHVYYGLHEVLPRPCLYLTLLRHPVARVASFYDYVRSCDWHHLYAALNDRGMSLRECLDEGLTIELDNFMTRTLAGPRCAAVPFGGVTRAIFDTACSHLESCTLVGTTERLGEFYRLLGVVLGIRAGLPPHVNKSPATERSELPARTADAILEHNRYDLALFQRAGDLLTVRLESCGIAAPLTKAAAPDRAAASPITVASPG